MGSRAVRRLAPFTALLLWAVAAPAGTIRFDNVTREIDWCEEVGEILRYGVQGVVFQLPKKDVEVIGLVCPSVEPPVKTSVVDVTYPTFPFTHYLRQIHANVRGRWLRSPDAGRGLRAVIRFEIGRDGRILGDPVVEKTSGQTRFDAEALRAVREARSFDPLPADFKGEKLVVHFGLESW